MAAAAAPGAQAPQLLVCMQIICKQRVENETALRCGSEDTSLIYIYNDI